MNERYVSDLFGMERPSVFQVIMETECVLNKVCESSLAMLEPGHADALLY